MKRLIVCALWIILIPTIAGCSLRQEAPRLGGEGTETADRKIRRFEVRGVVREIAPDRQRLAIEHEVIPGYMAAMTMPFTAGGDGLPIELEVDDQIEFTYHVAETESWIDNIRILPAAQEETSEPIPSVRLAPEKEPLNVGDELPDYAFENHENEAVNLKDYRGEALALTFIYTRCPVPDFCPRMSLRFREACELLAEDAEAPERWRLLTLTFDPGFDTPEVLKNYASVFACEGNWDYLTGEISTIDAITEQFGLRFNRVAGSLTDWDHNLRTVIVGPSGKVAQILIGNLWTAEELVAGLKSAR